MVFAATQLTAGNFGKIDRETHRFEDRADLNMFLLNGRFVSASTAIQLAAFGAEIFEVKEVDNGNIYRVFFKRDEK